MGEPDAVAPGDASGDGAVPAPPARAPAAPLGSLDRLYETVPVGEHQLLSCAPNSVCVVRLAPSHPCFAGSRRVVRVAFADAVTGACISGKRKKGAADLGERDVLATVHSDDGAEFEVVCGIRGRILEVADDCDGASLKANDGRVALLQARPKDVERLLAGRRKSKA